MSRTGTALLVFARAPWPGRTKTRLIPALGAAGAARLHERMVEHAVCQATESRLGSVTLCGAPDVAHPFFADLGARYGCRLHAQAAGDLGARMHAALAEALRCSATAILLGSDCPLLGAAELLDAQAALAGGVDVVLGPATDGGYVLVGCREPQAGLFVDMPWGGDQVMALSRKRMRASALSWYELPVRPDVDGPEDLLHLPADWQAGVTQRLP